MQAAAPRSPNPAPSADLGAGTVAAAAAAAALAAGCALASLTYGWSYTVAALVGATLASALAWVVWRRCPVERTADRGALLLATTLALALFAVYAADALDWRPFGIDDATAGLAVGFALLAAIPCRYALGRADVMPSAAGMTLTALVVALLAWTVLLDAPAPDRFDDAGQPALLHLSARAAAVMPLARDLRLDALETRVTFKDLNARGEGDYYAGLAPTCAAADDLAHALGDAEEASLKAALHYVRFGRCPAGEARQP